MNVTLCFCIVIGRYTTEKVCKVSLHYWWWKDFNIGYQQITFCKHWQYSHKSKKYLESWCKILGCKIQDVSTSILIELQFEEMSEDDEDESDKHLEAWDRRYSCLISLFFYTYKLLNQKRTLERIHKHSVDCVK